MKHHFDRLSMSRRDFLLGSSAFGALAAAGIKPGFAQAAPQPGGTLRVSVTRGPGKLNPLLHRNNAEYLLGEMLYSGLTRLTPAMTAAPDLAESWTSSADFSEWTFTLRQGVRFHHGPELTARDVVATFEAILDKATGSPARRNVGPIETITALDPHTVKFSLRIPYGDLPVVLAYTAAKVVPADILETDIAKLDTEVFGTGPFKLVTFDPAHTSVVERNPDYFIPARPYLDRVELWVFPDPTGEIASFLRRDIDLMMEVPPPEYERVSTSSNVVGLRTRSGRFVDLVLANDAKPFDDPRVRKALQLSLNRRALVNVVAEGYGRVGNDTPIMSAYRFYKKNPPIPRDVGQARQLLAEAGYPNGLSIPLIAANRPPIRTNLAVAVREMTKPAGFNITVRTIAYDTYLKQVWKKGNFYVGFYNMQPNEDAIFSLLYTSDAAWNQTRWNHKGFDELVEAARATTDPDERAELYGKAQDLMRAEAPTIIPFYLDLLAAKRSYVENFSLHPRGAVFNLHEVWLGSGAPLRR